MCCLFREVLAQHGQSFFSEAYFLSDLFHNLDGVVIRAVEVRAPIPDLAGEDEQSDNRRRDGERVHWVQRARSKTSIGRRGDERNRGTHPDSLVARARCRRPSPRVSKLIGCTVG